jgi:hypothetical protein
MAAHESLSVLKQNLVMQLLKALRHSHRSLMTIGYACRMQQAPIPSVQACGTNGYKTSSEEAVPCISDALAAYLALKGFNKGVVFTRTATRNVEQLNVVCYFRTFMS